MMITKVDKYVAGTYRQQFNMGLDFGALGGGILGSIGNLFGLNQQKKENARNRQFAHDEAVLAHERNLEIMDKTNEWNSPENQRKLLIEGGYNPNALFQNGGTVGRGSGSSGASQASSPPQGSVGQGLLDPSMISAISNAMLAKSQSENLDADTDYKRSQIKGQDLSNTLQELVNANYSKYEHLRIEMGLNKDDSERALNDAQRLLTNKQWDLLVNEETVQRPLEQAKLSADTYLSLSSAKLQEALKAKTDEERSLLMKEFALQTKVAMSTIALNSAQSYYAREQAQLIDGGLSGKEGGILYRNYQRLGTSQEYDNARMRVYYKECYNQEIVNIKKQLRLQYNLTDKELQRYGFDNLGTDFVDDLDRFRGSGIWLMDRTFQSLGSVMGGTGAAIISRGK